MVASKQVETPFCKGIGQHQGRVFVAFEQVFGGSAFPFFPKYVVRAAESIKADLLKPAAPEKTELVSGKKNFEKTAWKTSSAKTVG